MKARSRSERGHALTDLLICVAILGIVAAVALPNVTDLPWGATTNNASTELQIIQTAVDARMAAENATTTTAITVATRDMTNAAGGFGLTPLYMRSTAMRGTYTIDAAGRVTQVTTGS